MKAYRKVICDGITTRAIDYTDTPAGMSIKTVNELDIKFVDRPTKVQAALVAWKICMYDNEFEEYYFAEGKTKNELKAFITEQKEIYGTCHKDSRNVRMICFVNDLDFVQAYLRKDFDCEVFRVKGDKMASCVLDNFLELRDVSFMSRSIQDFVGKKDNKAMTLCAYARYFYDTYVIEKHEATKTVYDNDKKNRVPMDDTFVADIPLTLQMVVYQEMHNGMTSEDRARIPALWPADEPAYKNLRQCAFFGGKIQYNPSNCHHRDSQLGYRDFVSSYSTRMLLETYPMGPMVKCPNYIPNDYNYKYLIHFTATNVDARYEHLGLLSIDKDHIWRRNKKIAAVNPVFDEYDRLVKADSVELLLCDLDFEAFKWHYAGEINILGVKRAKADYLPDYIRRPIEKYFLIKATHKKGSIARADAKDRLEIAYGTLVKGIFTDYDKAVKKAIGSPYIGIWITAYARNALLEMIKYVGDDFVWCHTDSLIYSNPQLYEDFFEEYNKKQQERVAEYIEYHCVSHDDPFMPGPWETPDVLTFDDDSKEHEAFCKLGCFEEEEKTYITDLEAKAPNSLVYLVGERIETKIGGMPKHFMKYGKKVCALERDHDYDTILDAYMSSTKYNDFRECRYYSDTDKNEVCKFTKDGHIYMENAWCAKYKMLVCLTEQQYLEMQADVLKAQEEQAAAWGKIELI